MGFVDKLCRHLIYLLMFCKFFQSAFKAVSICCLQTQWSILRVAPHPLLFDQEQKLALFGPNI